jgi:MFS family permease
VVTGLGLQAIGLTWLATVTSPTVPYADLVVPFVVCGIGMTLFFVPLASLVLGAVPRALEGVASGANAAFRELGGVLGIAVLGAIFSSHGSYASGQDYVNGMTVAVYAGAAVVAIGAIAAMLVPNRRHHPDQVDLVAPAVLPDLAGSTLHPEADEDPAGGHGPARTLCESSPATAS